jgi:hypothetical protein
MRNLKEIVKEQKQNASKQNSVYKYEDNSDYDKKTMDKYHWYRMSIIFTYHLLGAIERKEIKKTDIAEYIGMLIYMDEIA